MLQVILVLPGSVIGFSINPPCQEVEGGRPQLLGGRAAFWAPPGRGIYLKLGTPGKLATGLGTVSAVRYAAPPKPPSSRMELGRKGGVQAVC